MAGRILPPVGRVAGVRILLLTLAALAACATTPPPAPASADSCALALSVRTIRPNEASRRHATSIYFVRLGEGADPAAAEPVILSNHSQGRVVYLLNDKPGTYAAVASLEKKDGRTFVNYFPVDLIRKTVTTVGPGEFAYMGTTDLEVTGIGGTPDKSQSHYEDLIQPNYRSKSLAFRIFDRSRFFLGKGFVYRRTDEALEKNIRAHLAAGGWSPSR
jgi:hypothetical protein